jgi:cellulose synthase/poly-beta-1,6-N-acetylglucosamine synthase-like glycosyltransferase
MLTDFLTIPGFVGRDAMVYLQILFLAFSLVLTFMFFIYGFNHYFLLSIMHRYRAPRISRDFSLERPFVSIQLPIYNERYVVRRLIASIARMVQLYGIEHAEICILDDSTDDTVELVDEIAQEYSRMHFQIHIQRRADRVGYKAGALQAALENTQAEFIAIFDADYTPTHNFLLRTIPYFLQQENLGIVQSRWSHLNRYYNLITRAIAIGIDVHFFVEQTARYATNCLQNFNGSGGVLRKSALIEAGGWQTDTLAEDLDASYRIQIKGYRVLYLRDLASPGEVPLTVPGFAKQQARWANGSLRTARKLLPSILPNRQLKPYQRIEAFIHLTGYILHPMMYTSFLLTSFGTIFGIDTFLIHTRMLTPFGGSITEPASQSAIQLHNISWGALDTLIILSMFAAWVSPTVSLSLQNLSLRKNFWGLLVLFLLGSGVSISNSIEAIKALLTNRQWEFKRTPKYATVKGKEGWRENIYQVPLDPVFVLEIASVLLGLVAISMAIRNGQFFVFIILIPYTLAYAFVAYLTIKQSRLQTSSSYAN